MNRNKIKGRPRRDSAAANKLEELFGSLSFGSRVSPSKFPYPNTVPQPKISALKNLSLANTELIEDNLKPLAFSSATVTKRRSIDYGTNQMYESNSVKMSNDIFGF